MESEAELLTLDGDDAALCNDSSEALPAVENCGQKEKSNNSVIAKIETYLRSYLSFPNERYFLPLALFAVLMHCWDECFDEVPYISVGASVKSAGKTRVLELLGFLAGVVRAILVDGSVTLAALYTEIDSGKILLIDESERLHNPRSQFRPILNGGYRRGQTTLRKISGQNQQFSIYCPKVFSHIGDLHDSLRDRCILVQMQRTMGGSRKEYNRAEAQADGNDIGQMIEEAVSGKLDDIKDAYSDYHELYPTLDFLRDRDKEIWKPLFSLCQVFAPSRIPELERSAIDISTLKTLPIRRFDMLKDEEEKLRKMEYAEQVLRDSILVIGDRDRISTAALIDGLRTLGTSPWRSYDGSGLTDMSLASLVKLFGVEPKTIRFKPKGEANSTAKGYLRTDLMAGAERAGVVPPMQNSGNPVTLAGESEAGCDDCLATAATPDTGCDGLHQGIVEMEEASPRWDGYRPAAPTPTTTATSEFATDSTITAATFSTRNTTTVNMRSQYSTSPSTAAYYPPSKSNEWYTPALYVEAVREVFDGCIQLDPASCLQANEVVRAERYYSLAEDGLAQPWNAETLFLNPPYGGQAGIWAQRLISEYESGNVGQAILLVFACTSEVWFRPLYTYPICFAEKRIRFYGPNGKGQTAPRGSALVYLGHDPARFTSVFSSLGQVVVPNRASDAAQPETHSGNSEITLPTLNTCSPVTLAATGTEIPGNSPYTVYPEAEE